MECKGLKELKNAFSQIQSDLRVIRQKLPDETAVNSEINTFITIIHQQESLLEKSLNSELCSHDTAGMMNYSEVDPLWRYYKDVLNQIFQYNIISNSYHSEPVRQLNNGELESSLSNGMVANKIYCVSTSQTLPSWPMSSSTGIDTTNMLSSGNNNNLSIIESIKTPYRNATFVQTNKLGNSTSDFYAMHGAGDTGAYRRSKISTQPEKDIEEIQQTISMQLKLQQHHSRHRYKFQPTHRAWPITPEINVVFQGNNSPSQYQFQNQLFATNSEPQIYTPNNIIGLQTQYPTHPASHTTHIFNHSLNPSNTFYGYTNNFNNQITNTAVLPSNDAEYAQLPSSIFGFLNNSSSRITTTDSNDINSVHNSINSANSGTPKTYENPNLAKNCDPKSNLIDYQLKSSTLTWEDLASVVATST